MNEGDFFRALKRLAEQYPLDAVDLWACHEPGNPLHFTAYVKQREDLPYHFCSDLDPMAAVEMAIKVAGPRDSAASLARKQKEIDDLRLKLAKLESELDPLLGPMAVQQQKDTNEHQNNDSSGASAPNVPQADQAGTSPGSPDTGSEEGVPF